MLIISSNNHTVTMKNKYLFIDRDGTLIREPEDEQVDTLDKLEFMPGVFRNLYQIVHGLNYRLVMVSNQDGLGSSRYPAAAFERVQRKMLRAFSNEGIAFDQVLIDDSTADDPAPTRKPGTGLVAPWLEGDFNRQASWVIGDRLTDIELAHNMGLKGMLFSSPDASLPENLTPVCRLQTNQWDQIYRFLRRWERSAAINRQTGETYVQGRLSLDGTGESSIHTGLRFLDHMLDQLARHGGFDLELKVEGDLDVDEHHTIEDTGLALGSAFFQALGDKKGLARYGFYVPMDESQASCLIDMGGRPYLSWEALFTREKIGDVPTEMLSHFFRSFADQARCNIHLSARGDNEHHKAEALFKAFARALRMATRWDDADATLPTTKGTL